MGMTKAQAQRLGKLIARARERKGFSLRELEAQTGIARSWLQRLEEGQYVEPPAPDRLARLAEALEIEPSRIDRITKGSVADSLPELPTYFRAKYDLTPEQIAQVERYVKRLRRAA